MIRRLVLPVALALGLLPLGSAGAAETGDALSAARELEARIARTIERVRPAVVAVFVSGPAPEGGDERRQGGGSGVLIDPRGLVLTNLHVVGWAEEIRVVLDDGWQLPARILGRDPGGDLALLEVEGGGPYPSVEFGDSDRLRFGQWVLAMGNPRGTASDGQAVVTWGAVTALHALGGGGPRRQMFYGDAIQTDAEINPGNSGGPLFTLDGKLIGINGRIATRLRAGVGAVNANVGFAIPSSQILRFLPTLKAGGTAKHGYLGVQVFRTTDRRVRITFVVPGSPAARAGLEAGDVLLRLDGQPVTGSARLTNLVSSRPAGYRAAIRIERKGAERIVVVPLGAREDEP